MNTSDTFTPRTKRTKWSVTAGSIIALLLIGAVSVYLAKINNKESSALNRPFTAEANISTPYVATITDTVLNRTHHTTVESDGHGDYNYPSTNDGMPMTTVYTPDGFYQCNSASQLCTKYPNDPSISNIDPGGYSFSSTKINDLKSTAKYNSQQKCPDSRNTCDVWYTTTMYNTSTYYYVDTANKKIMQTIHYGRFSEARDSAKITIKVAYDYKNVTVSIPTKYTVAPQTQ